MAADPTAACEWCGRAVKPNSEGRWYAVKGEERGYDPLTCEASDDCRHSPDCPRRPLDLLSPAELRRLFLAVNLPLPTDALRVWRHRGQLADHGRPGARLYSLAEVLACMKARHAHKRGERSKARDLRNRVV